MLTKEKCLQALRYITDLYEELYITRLKESGNHIDDTKEYWILEQLINEHFDNPPTKCIATINVTYDKEDLEKMIHDLIENKPLKEDEIKDGMVIWDNKRQKWLCIKWCGKLGFYFIGCDGFYRFDYEENRFYRNEVQE